MTAGPEAELQAPPLLSANVLICFLPACPKALRTALWPNGTLPQPYPAPPKVVKVVGFFFCFFLLAITTINNITIKKNKSEFLFCFDTHHFPMVILWIEHNKSTQEQRVMSRRGADHSIVSSKCRASCLLTGKLYMFITKHFTPASWLLFHQISCSAASASCSTQHTQRG